MRKLVSLQRIRAKSQILDESGEEAMNIELAQVLGWWCVVKKDYFEVGELVVFAEVDTVFPETLEAARADLSRTHMHVATKKFASRWHSEIMYPVISQGYVMKIEEAFGEGFDLTQVLGAELYDDVMQRQQVHHVSHAGTFPTRWLHISDQDRVQSNPALAERPGQYQVTEKIDGTSSTYIKWLDGADCDGESEWLCSRKMRVTPDESGGVWYTVAQKYNMFGRLEQALNELGWAGIAIQGEIAGPGVQKNPLGLSTLQFFLFSVWEMSPNARGRKLAWEELRQVATLLELQTVNELEIVTLPLTVPELEAMAERQSANNPERRAEGIVLHNLTDPELHFKVVSKYV